MVLWKGSIELGHPVKDSKNQERGGSSLVEEIHLPRGGANKGGG